MVFQARREQSHGTEESGQRWDKGAPDTKLLCEWGGVNRSGTAECDQGKLTWVVSSLGGNGAESPHDARIGDTVNSFGSFDQSQAKRPGYPVVHGTAG